MASVLSEVRLAAVIGALGARRTAELAASLGERIEDLLAALRTARDAPDLVARAHQLRGSASTLGMLALAEELERFEIALAQEASDGGVARPADGAQVRAAHAAAAQALASALEDAGPDHAGGRTSR